MNLTYYFITECIREVRVKTFKKIIKENKKLRELY